LKITKKQQQKIIKQNKNPTALKKYQPKAKKQALQPTAM